MLTVLAVTMTLAAAPSGMYHGYTCDDVKTALQVLPPETIARIKKRMTKSEKRAARSCLVHPRVKVKLT